MISLRAFGFTLLQEGSAYTNNPDDRGGPTKFGITLRTLADLYPDNHVDENTVRKLTIKSAAEIYTKFWEAAHCDDFQEPVAFLLFDAAIHHGPSKAIKLLQRACNLTEDGIVGPKTRATVDSADQANVCVSFLHVRAKFLRDITKAHANQKVFLKGWLRRIEKLSLELGLPTEWIYSDNYTKV